MPVLRANSEADMRKFRIVLETYENGAKIFVVQRRHWLFRFWWCSASLSEWDYANAPSDRCRTLEEAIEQLAVYENLHSRKIRTEVIVRWLTK